jgi:hypothetical protein
MCYGLVSAVSRWNEWTAGPLPSHQACGRRSIAAGFTVDDIPDWQCERNIEIIIYSAGIFSQIRIGELNDSRYNFGDFG